MVCVNLSREPVNIQLEGRFRSVSVLLRPLLPHVFEKAASEALALLRKPAALAMLALEAGVITSEDHERWCLGAEVGTEESDAFLAGLAHWAAMTTIAQASIESWEGLTNERGAPLALTNQAVAALMSADGISDQIAVAVDRVRLLRLSNDAGARP